MYKRQGQGAETDLIVGGELQLQVSADPIHATNKDYQYTTDQRDVATVSETGVIKAVGTGTATITVSATDSGKTMVKTIQVNVLEPPEKMVAFLIEDRLFEGNELNSFITFPLAGSEEDVYKRQDTDGFMAPGAASTADTESDALDVYYKDTAEQSVGQVIGSADFTEVDGSDSSRIDGFRKELEAEKPVEDAEISDDEIVNAILVLDSKSLLERGYEASEIPENFWAGLMEFWMNQKQNNVADEVQNTFEDITITYYYTCLLYTSRCV